MIWIEHPNKLAAMRRPGESYTNSMISIPITDEACEALKARNPGIDQDQTSRGRNGQLRIWVDRTFLDQNSGGPSSGRKLQRRDPAACQGVPEF